MGDSSDTKKKFSEWLASADTGPPDRPPSKAQFKPKAKRVSIKLDGKDSSSSSSDSSSDDDERHKNCRKRTGRSRRGHIYHPIYQPVMPFNPAVPPNCLPGPNQPQNLSDLYNTVTPMMSQMMHPMMPPMMQQPMMPQMMSPMMQQPMMQQPMMPPMMQPMMQQPQMMPMPDGNYACNEAGAIYQQEYAPMPMMEAPGCHPGQPQMMHTAHLQPTYEQHCHQATFLAKPQKSVSFCSPVPMPAPGHPIPVPCPPQPHCLVQGIAQSPSFNELIPTDCRPPSVASVVSVQEAPPRYRVVRRITPQQPCGGYSEIYDPMINPMMAYRKPYDPLFDQRVIAHERQARICAQPSYAPPTTVTRRIIPIQRPTTMLRRLPQRQRNVQSRCSMQ